MALNADSLADVADIAPLAARWLNDPSRPVVLSPARAGLDALWPALPRRRPGGRGVADVAIALPAVSRSRRPPQRVDWLTQPHPLRLVFTSANLSGAP